MLPTKYFIWVLFLSCTQTRMLLNCSRLVITLAVGLFTTALGLHLHNPQHDFYALESTSMVSKSDSIKILNKCKADCLKMGQHFPFKFKYHRYILREETGSNKYFEGNCLFSMRENGADNWYSWDNLKIYVTGTTFAPNMSQIQRWSDFDRLCENTALKMSEQSLKVLGFKRVHSNFEYYDDGGFKNLEPFTDINSMLSNLQGVIN